VYLSGPVTVCGMAEPVDRVRFTDRLRLEPIGPVHAEDLWRLHQDAAVAEWWGGRWTLDTARRNAATFGEAWRTDRVHKWIAYDRDTGELVGRGGLSRWRFEGHEWFEVGWTVRSDRWGRGYATEIGRAGLAFAFDELGATEVVAFTEPHNRRSRAVMERLGMRHVRDIIVRGEPYVLYMLGRGAA
jgi:RimJ/RimL family protein N-acetyltransferase